MIQRISLSAMICVSAALRLARQRSLSSTHLSPGLAFEEAPGKPVTHPVSARLATIAYAMPGTDGIENRDTSYAS
ncbi:MAG: hypothetical protein AAF385_15540 [Pseudomonadota bacterium]